MATRRIDDPVILKKFQGLKNASDDYEVGISGLSEATNVDISRNQKPKRRAGATSRVVAVSDAAWASQSNFLYTAENELYRMEADYSSTLIRADLSPSHTLVGYEVNGKVFYSNGIQTGCLDNGTDRPMGIAIPEIPTYSALSTGVMRAGAYQILFTFVRDDGQESGSSPARKVLLDDNSSIVLDLPGIQGSTHVSTNVYITKPNGGVFYKAAITPAAEVSVALNIDTDRLARPLKTQYRRPPPAFTAIDNYNGRMLYAVSNKVYFSDPFSYELVDVSTSLLRFKDRVTVMGMGTNGIFIGTDNQMIYLKGKNPKEFEAETLTEYGAVYGTLTYVDASTLGDIGGEENAASGILPMWMSVHGVCVGMPDGSVHNITQDAVDLPVGIRGTSMFRQENNQNHFITVIQE